ncbi:MAG: phosphatidylglycerol lysyltransferase domain-containing protein [Actinomycetota bacterium]
MKRPVSTRWKVILAARVLLILGLVGIASSAFKPFQRRLHFLESILPDGWLDFAAAGAIIVSALLIVLSFALARRNHAAYLLTQGLLAINVALDLFKGLYFSEAIASAALCTYMFTIRHEFYAKPVRRVMTRAIIVFAQIASLTLAIGILLILAPDRLFGGDVTAANTLETLFRGLVGLSGPMTFVSHREQTVFDLVMPTLGLLTIILPIFSLLQPSPPKPRMSAEDEAGLTALLEEFGERDSVGYFATREDKSVLWSNTRKSAITYRVVGGCALVSGDPLGNPDAWPQVIHAFMDLCSRNGWTPVAVGCSEEAGEIWVRETNMGSLEIGDEAIVHVSEYDLDNPRYRNVRQSVRRILKQGYTTQVVKSSEITPELRAQLTENSKKWRGDATERGFMMGLGRIAEENEPDLVVVLAYKDGEIRGILQYVPWGKNDLSLDLIRRSPHSDSGLSELMIDATITYARENKLNRISLNFAAFRATFERGAALGAGPVLKSWRTVLLFFSRYIQMESLYRFTSKFRPEWVPRYILFRKNSDLPKVGLATLRAEAFIGTRVTQTRKSTSLD